MHVVHDRISEGKRGTPLDERHGDPLSGLSRVARKLLDRSSVELSDVVATGPDGAITDEDVMAAVRTVEMPTAELLARAQEHPQAEDVDSAESAEQYVEAADDSAPEASEVSNEPDPAGAARADGDRAMSKQEELSRVISEMRRSIPELHGVMIASTDGLSIAHDFPESESEKIAAMAATALGLGQRITERANLGGLQEAVVRGDYGYLVVYGAGENAVLVLSGPSNSNLGLMRIEARAASAEISQVLR